MVLTSEYVQQYCSKNLEITCNRICQKVPRSHINSVFTVHHYLMDTVWSEIIMAKMLQKLQITF